MSRRYIKLGDGRKVTLGSYVAFVKLAKERPDATFKRCLEDGWPVEGSVIVAQFWRGVVDRINQGIPYVDRGARA